MSDLITSIEKSAFEAITNANSIEHLEELRIKYTGKKGKITEILKSLSSLSIDEKKAFGKEANLLKDKILEKLEDKKKYLRINSLSHFDIDVTLPETPFETGSYHPITIVQKEVENILVSMGFSVADTFEVETDYYNFEALNIPAYHPARDMQDTFYLNNGMVLRTQTSAGQVRLMEVNTPPLRIIIPGRCFRNENIDASHDNTFFQLEGIVIDEGISVANMLYTMEVMLHNVFNKDIKVRLRPGYFPFVEPGFELDISCTICNGKGCPTCKNSGWVELMPCGIIHPNVLKAGKIDSKKYTGFAFGLGLTRLAMMKYGIPDIRVFNSGDLRILKQFGGV